MLESDYDVTVSDATATPFFSVDGLSVGPGHAITVDGSAVANASLDLSDSTGDDNLTGGAKGDTFNLKGGHDTVHTGEGDNIIQFVGGLDKNDRLFGGSGVRDTVALYQGENLTITGKMFHGIEILNLIANSNFNITLAASLSSGDGAFLNVSAGVDAAHSVVIDGSAETATRLNLGGGEGADTITGGALDDAIFGDAGADLMKGGAGADAYGYGAASDSSSAGYDTIVGFDANEDGIRGLTVTGVDGKIAHGDLSDGSFDTDLSAACAGHLGANHALIFTPDSGAHSGETFLIVDRNAVAGYQTGDMVMRLQDGLHLAHLGVADFNP